MLNNTIVLPVDTANTDVTTDYTFRRFEEASARTVYINEADHSVATHNTLTFYRTAAKPNGNSKGVSKTAAKYSQSIIVPGKDGSDLSADAIANVSFNLPVGMTPAQTLELRQRLVALLDDDSVMAPLMDYLEI